MEPEDFSLPNGRFVEVSEGEHRGKLTFAPKPLPPKKFYDDELLLHYLPPAMECIGKLAGMGERLPNPHLLISSYIKREAVLSSRIEGTQASLSDLFLYEVTEKEPDEFLRLKEVRNYVRTAERCIYKIQKRGESVSLGLLKDAHKHLLRGVRGQERFPGEFREVQNWIGPERCSIDEATYVPPNVPEMNKALKRLEDFIQSPNKDVPPLIQVAMVHYQFEAIHPFADGNGRIGRLLITLLLLEKKILPYPMLYPSAFFETNKQEYYDKLLSVSRENDWTGWIKFFLECMESQAREAIENSQQIIGLQKKYEDKLRKEKGNSTTRRLVGSLFLNPYTTTNNAKEYLGVSYQTASNHIKKLQKMGILKRLSGKRNVVYVARELLKILEPKVKPLKKRKKSEKQKKLV